MSQSQHLLINIISFSLNNISSRFRICTRQSHSIVSLNIFSSCCLASDVCPCVLVINMYIISLCSTKCMRVCSRCLLFFSEISCENERMHVTGWLDGYSQWKEWQEMRMFSHVLTSKKEIWKQLLQVSNVCICLLHCTDESCSCCVNDYSATNDTLFSYLS